MDRSREAELLRQAQRGDDAAREALYRTYFQDSRQIRNLLQRGVPSPEDREDILHDAYISLIRSASQFRGESGLQTFVHRIVQVAILQKRRAGRARREDKMVRLTLEFEGEERERELPVQDYQFEEVEARAVAEKLYRMLPEPLRSTFQMRLRDEMSYDEIARVTNTPINTVATRIFKARAILARLFGAPESEEAAKKASDQGI
jgi:RNA polymerase sigma-70 factor (ECF subfamily)